MNVLVGCENSGAVRDAFRALGHNAWSCDILPTDADPKYHHQGDLLDAMHLESNPLLKEKFGVKSWDLLIAFPPCTHLASSGARWFKDKRKEQRQAIDFVRKISRAPIPRIAWENPVGVLSTHIRKPDQIIQPWQFGHKEMKTTCIWLVGDLPPLKYTDVVGPPPTNKEERKKWQKVWRMAPSDDRWKKRSLTYPGIAKAMASQWGILEEVNEYRRR